MLAQKAADNVCLQQALIWSYKLSEKFSERSIRHTISKCLDLNLYNNLSIAYQNLALNSILSKNGDPINLGVSINEFEVENVIILIIKLLKKAIVDRP